jgi:hypothetical protein
MAASGKKSPICHETPLKRRAKHGYALLYKEFANWGGFHAADHKSAFCVLA